MDDEEVVKALEAKGYRFIDPCAIQKDFIRLDCARCFHYTSMILIDFGAPLWYAQVAALENHITVHSPEQEAKN